MIVHIAELLFWGIIISKVLVSMINNRATSALISYLLRGEVNILALPRLAGENITSYAFCPLPVTYSQI